MINTQPCCIEDLPAIPSQWKLILPALILFFLFAMPVMALDPDQVLARITELCYEQPSQPPAEYARNELKKDPTLGTFYFKAIDAPAVGIDVKMSLVEALKRWDDPAFIDLVVKSFEGLEVNNPSTAMALVRLASQNPHDEFAPWLVAIMLRSYGGILPKDPDIYVPAMEALAQYQMPIIHSAIRDGVRRYGFDTVISSLSAMEMASVSSDITTSIAADDALQKKFNADSDRIIDSLFDLSSPILRPLLSANVPTHAADQILVALKLALMQRLLESQEEFQQVVLHSIPKFPILSDQLISACNKLVEKRNPLSKQVVDIIQEWESNPPLAIDLSKFRLQRVVKELSPIIETEGAFNLQPEDMGTDGNTTEETKDTIPWIIIFIAIIIAAFLIRRLYLFLRIRMARRRIKVLPLVFLLPAPIILFAFWKIFIETDPMIRDIVEKRQMIRYITDIRLFSRETLSGRFFHVAHGTDTLRREEIPAEKPAGEIRIVGIGESPMVASFFPREDGFLDLAIQAVASADPARRYRPINVASAGLCVFDHLFRLEDIFQLEPDIAVLYFISPVIYRVRELLESSDLADLQIKYPRNRETQKQLDGFLHELKMIINPPKGASPLHGKEVEQELVNFADRLFDFSAETFIRLLRENNIKIVIMLPASPSRSPVLRRMNDAMRDIAVTHNLPTVDANTIVKTEMRKTGNWRKYFWDQTHPARMGHSLIAEELAPTITKCVKSLPQ